MLFSAILLLLALESGVASPPPSAARIFSDVCLDGTGQFAKGQIQAVQPDSLPSDVRSLAQFSWSSHLNRFEPLSGTELPSQAFRVTGKRETFLVVPDQNVTEGFRSLCAVFVKRDEYQDAVSLLASYAHRTVPKVSDDNVVWATEIDGFALTAARQNGWTMISAIADPKFPEIPTPIEKTHSE